MEPKPSASQPPPSVSLDYSPHDADMAITSIDNKGTLGQLNDYVLFEYGYSAKALPNQKHLEDAGFAKISEGNRKPIIFIVTIDGERPTNVNLENNLYKGLLEFESGLVNKKVWIPLMGTGKGGLSMESSYQIITKTINRFEASRHPGTTFILSIPKNEAGITFFNSLTPKSTGTASELKILIENSKSNIYLVDVLWDNHDQTDGFFTKNI